MLGLGPNILYSKEVGPKAVVEIIFKKAQQKDIATDAKKQAALNKYINFTTMGVSILGKNKKPLSREQINWFNKTLKSIITRTVYPLAPKFFKDVKVTYEGVEVTKQNTVVKSVVFSKGEETEVAYYLKKFQKEWKIVDIAIDDESWTEGINEQVNRTIKSEKWAGVKKRLTKRLKELKNKKNKKNKSSKRKTKK